jgi:hypothetical protein
VCLKQFSGRQNIVDWYVMFLNRNCIYKLAIVDSGCDSNAVIHETAFTEDSILKFTVTFALSDSSSFQ